MLTLLKHQSLKTLLILVFETGNTLFTINEQFTSMESVQRHVENASKNDYFPDFAKITR